MGSLPSERCDSCLPLKDKITKPTASDLNWCLKVHIESKEIFFSISLFPWTNLVQNIYKWYLLMT